MPEYRSEKDLNQIRILRDAYQRAFQQSAHSRVSAESQRIPPEFDIKEKKVTRWILSNYTQGDIQAPPLTRVTLSRGHFDENSDGYLSSALMAKTEEIISTGTRYVSGREKSITRRRKIFSAYGDLQDPRYLMIYVVMDRVKSLCLRSTNDLSLVDEYQSLIDFIDIIISHSTEFKTSSTNGFHHFLSSTRESLMCLKNLALYYYKRQSIADRLRAMGNLVQNYREQLAAYALYVISDAKLDGSVSRKDIVEDTRPLPQELRMTQVFFNIESALTVSNRLQPLRAEDKSSGIAALIKKNAQCQKFLDSHFLLVKVIYNFQKLSAALDQLADSARINGEYGLVNDETLNALLNTNLAFVTIVMAEIDEHLNNLNSISQASFTGHERYEPGFGHNRTYTQQRYTKLQEQKRLLLKHKDEITQTIAELAEMSQSTVEAQCTELVINTGDLIQHFCDTDLINSEAAERMKEKLPFTGVQERRELMRNHSSALEAKDLRTIFPDVYVKMQDTPDDLRKFEHTIAQMEQEITVTAFEYLEQVREINSLAIKLNGLLNTALSIPQHQLAETDFFEAESVLSELKEKSRNTRYHNHYFSNFEGIADFNRVQVDGVTKKLSDELNRLLLEHPSYKMRDHAGSKLLANLNVDIKLHMVQFDEQLDKKVDEVKNELILKELKDKSLDQHFEDIIKHHKPKPSKQSIRACSYASQDASPTVQTISRICSELLTTQSTLTLKEKLEELLNTLKSTQYVVWHKWLGGGEKIQLKNGKVKVPRHIKKIIDESESALLNATTLQDYQNIRDYVFETAGTALANPPSHSCGLFKPRDATTQEIYQAFSDVQVAHQKSALTCGE